MVHLGVTHCPMIHCPMIHWPIIHWLGRWFCFLGRALFRRQVAHRAVVHGVTGMILRSKRSSQQGGARNQAKADHALALSGKGRTVTICIMPECM